MMVCFLSEFFTLQVVCSLSFALLQLSVVGKNKIALPSLLIVDFETGIPFRSLDRLPLSAAEKVLPYSISFLFMPSITSTCSLFVIICFFGFSVSLGSGISFESSSLVSSVTFL